MAYKNKNCTKKDGIIYLNKPLVSDGTTGEEWIGRLKKHGYKLTETAKQLLRSKDFKPTKGVVSRIAVLKGDEIITNFDERLIKKIRAKAGECKFTELNTEVGCLIRYHFTNEEIEEMGLWWIITMHKPIKDADGNLRLIGTDREDVAGWLYAYRDHPTYQWTKGYGFAFKCES